MCLKMTIVAFAKSNVLALYLFLAYTHHHPPKAHHHPRKAHHHHTIDNFGNHAFWNNPVYSTPSLGNIDWLVMWMLCSKSMFWVVDNSEYAAKKLYSVFTMVFLKPWTCMNYTILKISSSCELLRLVTSMVLMHVSDSFFFAIKISLIFSSNVPIVINR